MTSLPMCKYGASCFRKNPDHFKQFKHPQLNKNQHNNNNNNNSITPPLSPSRYNHTSSNNCRMIYSDPSDTEYIDDVNNNIIIHTNHCELFIPITKLIKLSTNERKNIWNELINKLYGLQMPK